MKKVVTVLLVICMIIALSACGGGGGGGDSADKDTLTIGVTNDYGTLDFTHQTSSVDFVNVARMYAEPLFNFTDNDGTIKWLLAEDWEQVTPTQWVFHLRKDVKFSNGNPFTADDVYFTLDKANNTAGQYPYFPNLDWENCKVIDDYTIEFNFTSYDLSYQFNICQMGILDAESYVAEDYAMNPIGTGPYVVTDYVVNSHTTMEANADYWGEPAKIKNLEFKVLNEDSQRINALEINSVDSAGVPTQEFEYVEGLGGFNLHTDPARQANAIWYNVTPEGLFNNVDARMAVNHAIDRESIIKLVFDDHATLCDWPHAMSAKDKEDRTLKLNDSYAKGYDPELAKQYVDKAGLAGKEIRLMTNGTPSAVAMAEIIQQNLIDVGCTVVINNYDEASYVMLTQDTAVFDLYLRTVQAPSNTAAQNYNGWMNVPYLTDGNYLGEGRDSFLEMNARVMSIADEKERLDVVFDMTEIFVNNPAWFGICEADKGTAVHEDLDGVAFTPYGQVYWNEWSWK